MSEPIIRTGDISALSRAITVQSKTITTMGELLAREVTARAEMEKRLAHLEHMLGITQKEVDDDDA